MEVQNSCEAGETQALTARPYQTQILEIALRQNVIIFLPTGSGKTYIAILAIKEMAKALLTPLSQGGKLTVFLANTVALARQQSECIRNLVNFKVRLYTGDMNVDNWKREQWREDFDEYQIIVATAQIVLDVIRHGFLSITDINLMIFDECHHAVNEHPMKQLMSQFQNNPVEKLPRVIGLTGLLLKSTSPVNIEDDLNKMEATFRATIVTASSYDVYRNVLVHSTKPTESLSKYLAIPPKESIFKQVEDLAEECTTKIDGIEIDMATMKVASTSFGNKVVKSSRKYTNLWNDLLHKLGDMGIYGTSIAVQSFMVELELKKRAAEVATMRTIARICISYAERIKHELVTYMKTGCEEDDDMYEIHEMISDNSSNKLQCFLTLLEMLFINKKPDEISCLVFVERRQTAKCLYYLVKHFVESKKNIPIIPDFIVGQNKGMPVSIETWLDSQKQKHVLRKFKKGECNMLIASSVLEEGIDVQSCNYVIMYDPIKHFGSYVQTKGRARMQDSHYRIMVEAKDCPKLLKKLCEWQQTEKQLKNYLIGKTIDRPLPLKEEIDEQFIVEIAPYYTAKGARLEAGSVMQLLNRYCMQLPQDSFTSSTVEFSVESIERGFVVRIVMPPQSTIKDDILSDRMPTLKGAKRSAAMKACIKLYENKELNEHLLPISKNNCFELVEDIYFKHWEDYRADDPRLAGTKKMRRLHDIQYPNQLTAATPQKDTIAYLYEIQHKPAFARDSTNDYIIDLLTTSSNFALLTSKPLPELAKMPLFLSQGRVNTEIKSLPLEIRITNDQDLTFLRRFHYMVFRDVLSACWNSFFIGNFENKENSFLVVPTRNDGGIDWDLVRRMQTLQSPRELTEMQRSKLTFNVADYENSVVCPWYSADFNKRYVVLKVLTDITPFSLFPSGNYASYAAYAKDKYGQNVVVKNQFMLLVQPLTSRVNMIHHGQGESGQKKKARVFRDVKLIPELCHNYRFPGDLWLKARFLPTVLHRIHYLLVAENLRISINNFLGVDSRNHQPAMLPVENMSQDIEEEDQDESLAEDSSTSPQKLLAKDAVNMEKVDLLDRNVNYKDYELPIDLDRNMDRIYEVELDYYMQFLSLGMDAFSNGKEPSVNNQIPSPAKIPKLAICDDPNRKNYTIAILNAQGSLNQAEMLIALTRKSAADAFNMERLELLGDSFLKFSASLYIFVRHSDWNEGCLTALKSRLVSNRNLFYHSVRLGIPGMLSIDHLDPRSSWQPPLVSVPLPVQQAITSHGVSPYVLYKLDDVDIDEVNTGVLKDSTMQRFLEKLAEAEPSQECTLMTFFGKRYIGDKTSSDVVEAILGACVKSIGIEQSLKMFNYFGILPADRDNDISQLLRKISHNPRIKPKVSVSEIDGFLVNYKNIEQTLGYTFKDRAYLLQALTHPSYIPNRLTGCYQTLEFLGDAILDFLISAYIFERCEHMGPGELTDLRSALVNNTFLACMTTKYKLHTYLLSQSATLMKAIAHFVQFYESQEGIVTDQVRILIQENECQISDYIEVPKALGDLFEALVGAVFLDSGNDLETTWFVIYNLISDEIAQYIQNVPKQLVRRLLEIKTADAKFMDAVVEDGIVMVKCMFLNNGQLGEVCGFGENKESAKIAAAKLALQILHNKLN